MECQKRKQQTKSLVYGEQGYCSLLILEVTMHSTRNHITKWYRCQWLLCIQGFLLQATAVNGYYDGSTAYTIKSGNTLFIVQKLKQKLTAILYD